MKNTFLSSQCQKLNILRYNNSSSRIIILSLKRKSLKRPNIIKLPRHNSISRENFHESFWALFYCKRTSLFWQGVWIGITANMFGAGKKYFKILPPRLNITAYYFLPSTYQFLHCTNLPIINILNLSLHQLTNC